MTSCEPKSDRKKRKSTHVNEIPEVLVINDGNDEIQSLREIKAHRVLSTDAATSTTLAANRNSNVTSPVTAHADALVTTVNSERKAASTQTSSAIDSTAQKCDTVNDNASRTTITQHEESLERIGKQIHCLFHFDVAKVNAALDALFMDLSAAEDDDSPTSSQKCETIIAVGGVHALVLLVEKSLTLAVTKVELSGSTSTSASSIYQPIKSPWSTGSSNSRLWTGRST
jgi:hypothetical protein